MISKIKKKLISKKRNSIKSKKEKLCNQINRCKTLKELEGWERTFLFYPVLKDDHEWDYGYFIDLIEFKLKLMRDFFYSRDFFIGEKDCGDICNKLINLLHAGYKTEIILNSDLKRIYVNTKNSNRFLEKHFIEMSKEDDFWKKYGLAIIREYKAKKLFWKYLHHKIEYLWE